MPTNPASDAHTSILKANPLQIIIKLGKLGIHTVLKEIKSPHPIQHSDWDIERSSPLTKVQDMRLLI